jgi:integrase/recombinase XerD
MMPFFALVAERKACMPENLSPQVCQRIRSNPIGPILERYLEYLMARGYSRRMWWPYLRVGEHYGRWLGRRRIRAQTVEQFLKHHLPDCRCAESFVRVFKVNRAGLGILLMMLGASPPKPILAGFAGRLLSQYARYLTTARGLMASSVAQHMAYTKTMLQQWRICRAAQLRNVMPLQIDQYLSRERPGRNRLGCLRSFLRYLLQQGLIERDLAGAVPTFVRWRLAALPPTLTKEEVNRLLDAADEHTPVGLRDRAIFLCLSELGLRASDVAGLQLADVDLPQRILRLRRCKQRDTAVLPIPARVAGGLKSYLRRGRPVSTSAALFVRHHAPLGQPLTPLAIGSVVRALARRARLQDRVHGAHILRHSLARRLLAAGANLKQIADVLGHQSIDTTAIYAKVDVNALQAVALPWPSAKEVRP